MPAFHTAGSLRREVNARNRVRAETLLHEATYGRDSSVIYADDRGTHGNFLPASYRRIRADKAWSERLIKAYTASARVPRSGDRRRAELECATSSDALLMNLFCYPGAMRKPGLLALFGICAGLRPEFGVRVRLPMRNDEVDRTEIDMRIADPSDKGPLLFEAKLTETNFQYATTDRLLRYAGVETVFDVEALPRSGTKIAGYQLIRGVLAALAGEGRFVLLADRRRSDLVETWFRVLSAVHRHDFRSRMALVTWQEIGVVMPLPVREFLLAKYGIE